MPATKLPDGRLLAWEQIAGPDTYNEAMPPTITFTDFQQGIEAVLSCYLDSDGPSFLALPAGVSGRTVTVRVLGNADMPGDGDPLRELDVCDAVDLSGRTIVAVAVGT
jgi:hypothetical protein